MKGPTKRPLYGDLVGATRFLILCLVAQMRLFWLSSFIVRIVIEVRLGWSNLSPLGKAATMTFVFESMAITNFLIPTTVPQILFIIDRIQTAGALSSMDIAYLVLRLLGHLWMLLFVFWSLSKLAHPIMYRMWLDSFSPNWPENAGWDWKLCCWIAKKGHLILKSIYERR